MVKFDKYTGTEQSSIVNALAEMKIDSGFYYRKQIAAANGIADYTGTAEQNLKMLGLLKAGELVRPEAATPATTDDGKKSNLFKYGGIAAAIALALYLAFKAGKNSKGEDAPASKSDRERRRAELRRKKRQ